MDGHFGLRSLLWLRVDIGVEERGEAKVVVELTADTEVPRQLLHASIISMSSVRLSGRAVRERVRQVTGRLCLTNQLPERRPSPTLTSEAVTALKVITFGSTPVSSMHTNQASALFTPPTLAKALITMIKLMVSPFPGLVSADQVAERVPLSVDELGGLAGDQLLLLLCLLLLLLL